MQTSIERILQLKCSRNLSMAVVIPFYRASALVGRVIEQIPEFVDQIIVVDDCSPDPFKPLSAELQTRCGGRLRFVRHSENRGVGGATITGWKMAAESGIDVMIKMDADDQMDPVFLPELVLAIVEGRGEYAKGNRFYNFRALSRMPLARRWGNLVLSFMTKAATGYWTLFDPANGYLAISRETFLKLDEKRLSERYFFETSLLKELYYNRASVYEVSMPARYGEEESNLAISKVSHEFIIKLTRSFLRRLLICYYIYDFNPGTIYLTASLLLLPFALIYGGINWYQYAQAGVFAPTGTIMIAFITLVLGVQFGLQFLNYDVERGASMARR